ASRPRGRAEALPPHGGGTEPRAAHASPLRDRHAAYPSGGIGRPRRDLFSASAATANHRTLHSDALDTTGRISRRPLAPHPFAPSSSRNRGFFNGLLAGPGVRSQKARRSRRLLQPRLSPSY